MRLGQSDCSHEEKLHLRWILTKCLLQMLLLLYTYWILCARWWLWEELQHPLYSPIPLKVNIQRPWCTYLDNYYYSESVGNFLGSSFPCKQVPVCTSPRVTAVDVQVQLHAWTHQLYYTWSTHSARGAGSSKQATRCAPNAATKSLAQPHPAVQAAQRRSSSDIFCRYAAAPSPLSPFHPTPRVSRAGKEAGGKSREMKSGACVAGVCQAAAEEEGGVAAWREQISSGRRCAPGEKRGSTDVIFFWAVALVERCEPFFFTYGWHRWVIVLTLRVFLMTYHTIATDFNIIV